MHARLGHYERLQALFEQAKGRDVRGAGTELASEAKEGLWRMQHEPGEAFRCGPLALARVYGYTHPNQALPQQLDDFKSTTAGTSLYEVNAWAEKIKLGYQMAYRNPGADVIVPSVIHWKVGHFAALLPGPQDGYIFERRDLSIGRFPVKGGHRLRGHRLLSCAQRRLAGWLAAGG